MGGNEGTFEILLFESGERSQFRKVRDREDELLR